MMARKLKTLAKDLELEDEYAAAIYIYATWRNGNISTARQLFFDLTKTERVNALYFIQAAFLTTDNLEEYQNFERQIIFNQKGAN